MSLKRRNDRHGDFGRPAVLPGSSQLPEFTANDAGDFVAIFKLDRTA